MPRPEDTSSLEDAIPLIELLYYSELQSEVSCAREQNRIKIGFYPFSHR